MEVARGFIVALLLVLSSTVGAMGWAGPSRNTVLQRGRSLLDVCPPSKANGIACPALTPCVTASCAGSGKASVSFKNCYGTELSIAFALVKAPGGLSFTCLTTVQNPPGELNPALADNAIMFTSEVACGSTIQLYIHKGNYISQSSADQPPATYQGCSGVGSGAYTDCRWCKVAEYNVECVDIVNALADKVCRPSTGNAICDPPEEWAACSCPADVKAQQEGTVCLAKTAGDVCDADDTCDDKGTCVAKFATAGTACGADETGTCLKKRATCSGTDAICPANEYYVAGDEIKCGADPAACEKQAYCAGSLTCPDKELKADGTSCRAAAGCCDVAEVCDGKTATCPADAKQGTDVVCLSYLKQGEDGSCSMEEVTCDGDHVKCPSKPTPETFP